MDSSCITFPAIPPTHRAFFGADNTLLSWSISSRNSRSDNSTTSCSQKDNIHSTDYTGQSTLLHRSPSGGQDDDFNNHARWW